MLYKILWFSVKHQQESDIGILMSSKNIFDWKPSMLNQDMRREGTFLDL